MHDSPLDANGLACKFHHNYYDSFTHRLNCMHIVMEAICPQPVHEESITVTTSSQPDT